MLLRKFFGKRKLSHVDCSGSISMVDISNKPMQKREAIAKGVIYLSNYTIKLIEENQIKKGDVLTLSKISGIQAAKKTSSLIPLTHAIDLKKVDIILEIRKNFIESTCYTICIGQTGAEMEALVGVSLSLLTIYDMCKAVDNKMWIKNILLIDKVKEDV